MAERKRRISNIEPKEFRWLEVREREGAFASTRGACASDPNTKQPTRLPLQLRWRAA
jgi:hypothetical protein